MAKKNKKPVAPKRRNMVAFMMMERYRSTSLSPGDKKKKASKRGCRARVRL
jgi:hypothetical protein